MGEAAADRRLLPDRLRHADWSRREERHSNRRIRQAAARGGARDRRSGEGGGPPALAPDPDDRVRVHSRRLAAGVCERRRGREPPIDRHYGFWRDARRYDPDPDLRSGFLRSHRGVARTRSGDTGARDSSPAVSGAAGGGIGWSFKRCGYGNSLSDLSSRSSRPASSILSTITNQDWRLAQPEPRRPTRR